MISRGALASCLEVTLKFNGGRSVERPYGVNARSLRRFSNEMHRCVKKSWRTCELPGGDAEQPFRRQFLGQERVVAGLGVGADLRHGGEGEVGLEEGGQVFIEEPQGVFGFGPGLALKARVEGEEAEGGGGGVGLLFGGVVGEVGLQAGAQLGDARAAVELPASRGVGAQDFGQVGFAQVEGVGEGAAVEAAEVEQVALEARGAGARARRAGLAGRGRGRRPRLRRRAGRGAGCLRAARGRLRSRSRRRAGRWWRGWSTNWGCGRACRGGGRR